MNKSKEQLIVVWRIYEPCNLSCHFCGYSREIVRKRHIANPQVLYDFGKILSDFQKNTDREVLVSWLGGEPLLWKELHSISQMYHKEYAIKLGITTNGTLLHKESVRASLISDYSLATISIDGFADFHDLHRGEQGLFEEIKKYVAQLIEEITASNSPLKLRVNTILMHKNLDQFESFCMEMAGWGIHELTFNQLGGIDRPEFYLDNRLLPEQAQWLAKQLPSIQEKSSAKGLKIFGGSQYLERLIATSNDVAIPIEDCKPGRKFLFINEENMVSPCNFTTEGYGIPLSEISDVKSLLNVSDIFRYKQPNERAVPCNNCHSTQIFEKFIS